MQTVSFLDDIVARFRHRWHTDSQYRAMMSGLSAVVVLIALCSCAGIVSTVTNNVFYGSGLASGGGPGGAGSVPGGGVLQGAASFPTASLPPWTPGTVPNANPVPPSQTPPPTPTPVPTATPTPTATPCTSNCGGGGGGGGRVTITVTDWTPKPWTQGSVSVTVHTSVPNDGVNLIITNCTGGTVLSASSNPNATTDGSGNYTFSFSQSGPHTQPSADVWATAQNGSGAGVHAYPPCG
jgi:hypothetical protein